MTSLYYDVCGSPRPWNDEGDDDVYPLDPEPSSLDIP